MRSPTTAPVMAPTAVAIVLPLPPPTRLPPAMPPISAPPTPEPTACTGTCSFQHSCLGRSTVRYSLAPAITGTIITASKPHIFLSMLSPDRELKSAPIGAHRAALMSPLQHENISGINTVWRLRCQRSRRLQHLQSLPASCRCRRRLGCPTNRLRLHRLRCRRDCSAPRAAAKESAHGRRAPAHKKRAGKLAPLPSSANALHNDDGR